MNIIRTSLGSGILTVLAAVVSFAQDEVVRVETIKTGQVIYYRRGNNGRGRGLGPVEKMVVRPSGSTVVVESAPKSVWLDIRVRLGL